MARRERAVQGCGGRPVAGVFVVASGLVAGLGRLIGGAPTTTQGSNTLTGGGAATPTTSAGSSTTSGGGATPTTVAEPKGTAVGPASGVPVGGSASFTDPGSGDPALVIQQTAGDFVAFDAVCPHEGCTVAYQAVSRIIACPCHGSEFNARTGNVINGPATNGLTSIEVAEGANGNLYVRR